MFKATVPGRMLGSFAFTEAGPTFNQTPNRIDCFGCRITQAYPNLSDLAAR